MKKTILIICAIIATTTALNITIIYFLFVNPSIFGGISGGSSGITSSNQLIRSGTDVSLRNTAWELGIGSSTPNAQLSIGAGGAASSTIMTGKFCMYAIGEDGVGYYIYIPASSANGQPFATTSTSCF